MMNFLSRIPTPMARWSRLLGLASVVGILAGLAAAVLKYGLHEGSRFLVGRFTDLGQAHVLTFRAELLLLPALGGLVAGVLVHWLCPRLGGHGTDLLIRAFHRQGGVMPLRGPTVNAAGAIGVISCGGSAGPEGPIAALGAAIGSALGHVFSLTPRERRIMLIAGCGAGVGAIFQCPLGGALFAVSVLYREPDYETDAIVPAFIASVVGYSVYMTFWGYGAHLLHGANTLVFSSPRELIPYAILGPVCGLFCIVFRACLWFVEKAVARAPRVLRWLSPALGGLATGAVACVLPQVMDGQYLFIQNAMDGNFMGGFEAQSWWMWAALFGVVALAKCLATALTVGSGAPGGVLGPCVFIGGAVGAFVGALVSAVAPHAFTSDPDNLRRALIPVAMAGVLSASMRVPLASLVIVTEMTGSYGLIVPLMVVCTSSYLVGRRWGLNDEQVRSSTESPVHAGDAVVHMLEVGRVEDVMHRDWPGMVRPDTTLGELVARVEPGTRPAFAVVQDGVLKGMIFVPEITRIMNEPGISEVIIAADIMTPEPDALNPDDDLYTALAAMARNNDVVMPVVARDRREHLVGMLTRRDIYRTVRRQLDDLGRHLVLEHEALASIEHEETLHQLVTGVPAGKASRVQRLLVPIQAIGLSLRQADFRRKYDVQVIGIEQTDGTIQCPPDVDAPLKTDQRLIGIVGEQQQTEST
ncbi:MAG: chloride channel protein [Phycisphaerales bacterium]|nr:MAG: chloride channel protein [Phycisphaerales bacterium]